MCVWGGGCLYFIGRLVVIVDGDDDDDGVEQQRAAARHRHKEDRDEQEESVTLFVSLFCSSLMAFTGLFCRILRLPNEA